MFTKQHLQHPRSQQKNTHQHPCIPDQILLPD
uniref:Uncharacterized protein n=1 Tax=Rhizophora mucronata TaxID=61149 RepID=A0A2P2QW50_RHIMU